MPEILTIGHSNRSFEDFLHLLQAHGVRRLADVRTAPGSRRNPQFMSDELARALVQHDIAYTHLKELGGFRKPAADSPNAAWRNDSFRGYADYMGTPAFREALDGLIALAEDTPTAVMCAEAVPWRCHRSLIADALTVRGIPVRHIMSEAPPGPHRLTPFARVEGERLTYPPPLAAEEPCTAPELREG
jgi:uncharacterized protein (DUF488 family)